MPSAARRRLSGIAKGLFKRSLFGYRRKPVDDALASLEAELRRREGALEERAAELESLRGELAAREHRMAELDAVAYELAGRVVERERELRRMSEELEELRPLRDELEALRARQQEEGQTRARMEEEIAELGAQARGQATRIRMQALRHAAQLAGRGKGGSSVQSGPEGPIRIERRSPESGGEGGGGPAAQSASAGPAATAVALAEERAAENGHAHGATLERFEGLVQVEIGPLSDFSQLVRFEDAANQIGATSEISVKRFSKGRATLAMRLDRPVELLRELEERAPFPFRVRSLRDDRLILDVEEG